MNMTHQAKTKLLEEFLDSNPSLKLENQNPYKHSGAISREKKSNVSELQMLKKATFPKRNYTLTEEQVKENEAYYDFVKYPPKKKKMTVSDAKRLVWDMVKEDDKEKNRTFILDRYAKDALNSLCHYFMDEKCNLDNRKGIWLYGKLGSGKTYMANLFSRFTRKYKLPRCYWMNSMQGIRQKVKSEKSIDGLDKFFNGVHGFDDVGQERSVNVYGDKEDIFQIILENNYRKWEDDGQIMIVTSNLLPQKITDHLKANGSASIYEIDSRYDERTSDRINQMFNFIPLMGKNKRRL